MQVKSFTYERAWFGTYYRQRFFSMERMDGHVAKMLGPRVENPDADGSLRRRKRLPTIC
jgi:hypothetical protein